MKPTRLNRRLRREHRLRRQHGPFYLPMLRAITRCCIRHYQLQGEFA